MKHIYLSLLFLLTSYAIQAQKNLLITTILLEGENTPAKGIEIQILDQYKTLLKTLTTDQDGKINYSTDQPFLNLDIRSNNLDFKSQFKQVNLTLKDTTFQFYALPKRDSEEVEKIRLGTKMLPPEDKSSALVSTFCPNFISGTQDTATFKEVYSCLISNLKYPEQAQYSDVEGKIRIRFIIDENGEINNIELLNSSYAILEEEALRAASCLSGMSPGTCDGKKVPTYYVLPLSFRLK